MADILNQEEIDALLTCIGEEHYGTINITLDENFRDKLITLFQKHGLNCSLYINYPHIITFYLNKTQYDVLINYENCNIGIFNANRSPKYYLSLYFYDIPDIESALNTVNDLINLIKSNPDILVKHLVKQINYNRDYDNYYKYYFNMSNFTYYYTYQPPKINVIKSL